MAKPTTPVFAATQRSAAITLDTANANRDGTGTIVQALTGAANGLIIYRIRIKATGTTTAGMIRVYFDDGTTAYLIHEIPVTAITPGANIESFSAEWAPKDLFLPSATEALEFSTHNAETFRVTVFAGEFD